MLNIQISMFYWSQQSVEAAVQYSQKGEYQADNWRVDDSNSFLTAFTLFSHF